MKRVLVSLVMALLIGSVAHAESSVVGKLKTPIPIAHYAAGDVECTIGGKTIKNVKPKYYELYYYAEMPTRIWLHIGGGSGPSGDFLLGNDDGCHLPGARSVSLD